MSKIARITTQQKSNQRYNIYLADGDGEKYSFSVDEAILIEYHLRKGLELQPELIETLKQKDDYYQSYNRAIHYLSYRMRTKKEVYDYLMEKEVDENAIPDIIERLVHEGLLNDSEFAQAFVRTRINTSSKGPQLVKKELIEKGVSPKVAEDAITQYTYNIQYERAMKWIQKRLRTSKKDSFQKQRQKIQSTLMQKGFTQDVIYDALDEVQKNQKGHQEWDALIHHGEKLLRKHQRKFSGFELEQKMKESLYRQGFPLEKINQLIDEHIKE